ncbi:MAG TPA: PilN domain-containing protein, partial [Terriglobia bacterium]|nr:PilN domain-containing protein [Terriglobia bacterium]
GPTRLMMLVAAAVQAAPGLYLQSVSPKADRLLFSGSSRSVTSVASLVAKLENTPTIHDVELRQYFEDDDKDGRLNFKFDLDFAYQPAGREVPKQVMGTASAPHPAPGPGI